LKGRIESPNALRWRLGRLLRCAFNETESSTIGKLGPYTRLLVTHVPATGNTSGINPVGAQTLSQVHACDQSVTDRREGPPTVTFLFLPKRRHPMS
jgi:hypothetical protein